MKRRLQKVKAFMFLISLISFLSGCSKNNSSVKADEQSVVSDNSDSASIGNESTEHSLISIGTSKYQDFILDNVYHSKNNGDIHYHSFFPDNYNSNESYALFISLPGYGGLYFQGVGANIQTEDFAFEAQKYNDKMIIIAPQLNDWGTNSANQAIDLIEYIIDRYPIDTEKVYIDGYSGGGETLSLVLTLRPELFTRALHIASVWDGQLQPLVNAKTPVYFVIGEDDEYYGSGRISNTYGSIVSLYQSKGLPTEEIDRLVVLDVKNSSYFNGGNQHGGIGKVSHDEDIMNWLFRR